MSENYTWDESAGGFAAANSALIQRVRELEAENVELRAKLDDAMQYAQYYAGWMMNATSAPLSFDAFREAVQMLRRKMQEGEE